MKYDKKKSVYIQPSVKVIGVQVAQLLEFTGGGTDMDDPIVVPGGDDGDGPQRMPRRYNVWDD